jgi:hypothetical protein
MLQMLPRPAQRKNVNSMVDGCTPFGRVRRESSDGQETGVGDHATVVRRGDNALRRSSAGKRMHTLVQPVSMTQAHA